MPLDHLVTFARAVLEFLVVEDLDLAAGDAVARLTTNIKPPVWSGYQSRSERDETSVPHAFSEILNQDDGLCVDDLAGGDHRGGLL